MSAAIVRVSKRWVDGLFHRIYGRLSGMRKQDPTKTLLLVRTDGIGDLVYFSRYLPLIRAQYSNHKIVLCCRMESAELAKSTGYIDEVIPIRIRRCRRNYLHRVRTLERVRSVRPELAVYVSYHREQIGDELTLFSGAGTTIAFTSNDECIHPTLRQMDDAGFSRLVQVSDHCPEKERYRELLNALNCGQAVHSSDAVFGTVFRTEISPRPGESDATDATPPLVMIGAGGSGPIRRWPVLNFAALCDAISAEFGFRIALCGNEQEHSILTRISKAMKTESQILASLSLPEVVSVIGRSAAFVGNESGLLHIAASLGIPSLGILGGGHFSRYFPYGSVRIVNHPLECYECNWVCKFPEPYCLTHISVDDVLREFRNIVSPVR